jgi:hypothetical protein
MAKKHILQHEYRHTFKVIGISSAQKDYRMCWLINKQLGYDLKRLPDFVYKLPDHDKGQSYSVYHYEEPAMFLHINLMSNKSDEDQLFPQPKNIDYLLLFKQPSEQLNMDELVKAIRKIPQVQAAFLFSRINEKKFSSFFFDFELFLTGQS